MTATTQADRDRAARGGRLAARSGAGAGSCPYDANGDARQRQLALVYVRAYLAAGGTLDGLDYGDNPANNPASPAAAPTSTRATRSTRPGGRPYGHLGYQ
ncbi:hypothetical protein C5N14_30855 [Micromonospora sp. MW-13]|uniref:hypothetical protein n=1 Tax=Micromonospora sp. MW-13 TaxID=2094022 RepID=UPI000E43387C|nr:hypothetical protein [Micromonospora sp. MW-13]RGC64993.1 hypothetical protein C5N14_30855 [Micromonospora sp. MW-13]